MKLKAEIFSTDIVWEVGEEDGYYNAGYAVWREAIADIMADSIMSEICYS